MSKYTMELREVISTFGEDEVKSWFMNYELSDFLSREEINLINERGVWSKEKLASRILDHFYTREIGTDGIGQFMLFIKDQMREIMETYAPIIYSASLKYNPMDNMNVVETYSGVGSSNRTDNTKSNGSSLRIDSDTPQGQIDKDEILEGKYATNTSANENEDSATLNSTAGNTNDYTRTTTGNTGVTSATLIQQYRNVIRAINSEIVYNLEPLFMGVY